jgi:adenylate cyclase
VKFGLINGVLNGLFISGLEVAWVRRRRGRRLRRLPLMTYTLMLAAIWTLIIVVNMALTRHWLDMAHDINLSWMQNQQVWRHFIFCFSMAVIFNFLLRIVSFLGSRSLVHLILGHYQEPVEEELAFMFVDIVGSTQLTEQIGDANTQKLIGDLFFLLAETVDEFDGEVHRYIGDEMVVTWDISKQAAMPDILGCLGKIFSLVDEQQKRAASQFDVTLKVRAGLHAGRVLVSEVGDLKRELVYFGDTINVAAGLQSHCKEVGTSALISHELHTRLSLSEAFSVNNVGAVALKGKRKVVNALALTPITSAA